MRSPAVMLAVNKLSERLGATCTTRSTTRVRKVTVAVSNERAPRASPTAGPIRTVSKEESFPSYCRFSSSPETT